MNLRRLETFYWAAKLGSFTSAAERLNSTQSTVSMRIQDLERELGVTLFDRSHRIARVTEIGIDLLEYAEQILRTSAEMHERIAAKQTLTGTLRLGVAEVVSLTWLPKLLAKLHARYPKLQIELEEALTDELVVQLKQDTLDVILAPVEVPGYKLNSISLGKVEFAWMASPSLGVPDKVFTPRDLQHLPMIALSEQSCHHGWIEDWFHSDRARFFCISKCKTMSVAASLTKAGQGITVLPVTHFSDYVARGELQQIDVRPPLPKREFLATIGRNSLSWIARRTAELAQDVSEFDDVPGRS